MKVTGMLIFFHCGANTGYAIASLEKVFFEVAKRILPKQNQIHFAYASLGKDRPTTLPADFQNIIQFDPRDGSLENLNFIEDYIKQHKINVAFGFDQPVSQPVYKTMRRSGVERIIAYWGAPMGDLNRGLKLWLKRLGVRLQVNKPDHFIFESYSMAETAVNGRGINKRDVSTVYLGVDTRKYTPPVTKDFYAHDLFRIHKDRKILFYSGHMEERKGVHVIIKAAVELLLQRQRKNIHFLLLGNKEGEEKRFDALYLGTEAEKYITFGGYRNDIPHILRSCYAGVIASTGWDSFTMSSVEMAASGLPLVVSNLQGLAETVVDGKTGYLFRPGDHQDLCDKLESILSDQGGRQSMSEAARLRVEKYHTVEKQIENITAVVKQVINDG